MFLGGVSFIIFLASYIFIRFLRGFPLLESILVMYIFLENYLYYYDLYILPHLMHFTIFNIFLKFFLPNICFSGYGLYNQVICFLSFFLN